MPVLADADFSVGEFLLWLVWIFLFVIWFWLLITIFADLFRRHIARLRRVVTRG